MRAILNRNRNWLAAGVLAVGLGLPVPAQAQSEAELLRQLQELRQQLEQTEAALAKVRAEKATRADELARAEESLAAAEADSPIQFGPLTVGGAMRVNYVFGDYTASPGGGASRSKSDGGNFEFDTFRLNLDYARDAWVGKVEYRFYDGYHFLHTGWLGYNFADGSQLQVGVNRVPFGPGPYGVSQSWMFDQHYYVGLADDMDLGVKYTRSYPDWSIDTAYYYSDEGSYKGSSRKGARYSYDVIDESGDGYEERNQFNLRLIRHLTTGGGVAVDLGGSLQYGQLKSRGPQSDGEHYAASLHAVSKWHNWTLATQLTHYKYHVGYPASSGFDDQGGRLVEFGAYDYATPVAAEAWIPAISLSYYLETPRLAWLDYLIPYIEYSSLVKKESDFNNSEMVVLGAAWARGNWYSYTDLAFSNGNDFVGNTSGWERFGANPDDQWEYRFNVNLGYYF